MNKKIMITGANNGLGKEAARQLALLKETEKIYLACRNPEKAEAAKKDLERLTKRKIFEIVIMDVSSLYSVQKAVSNFNDTIDALIMNAGGFGSRSPHELTKDGVTIMSASNILGHALLTDELLKAKKLTKVALYASSEAARGVETLKIAAPDMGGSTEDEFASIMDGRKFGTDGDPMEAYANVKYLATMWMASLAREYPEIRFITMSPGSTKGTSAMENLPAFQRFMFKYVMMPIVLPLKGLAHSIDVGAKRYVDGINDESLTSGAFYASDGGITGKFVDQSVRFAQFANKEHQDNANKAVHRFLKSA